MRTTATALAALAAAGHAAAFAPTPVALQRFRLVSAGDAQYRTPLALRAENNPLGSLADAREAAVGREDGQELINSGAAGFGAKSDPVGKLYVEVAGEYVDSGYVDDSTPAWRQGSGKGLFGGLFGGNDAEKQAARAREEKLRREMDVIQFVDPDAKPGLMHKRPSYFDEDIVGNQKNSLGLFKTDMSGRQRSTGAGAVGAPPAPVAAAPAAPAPLPEGWYAAFDEAQGKEYYYTAAGDVTWERPQ